MKNVTPVQNPKLASPAQIARWEELFEEAKEALEKSEIEIKGLDEKSPEYRKLFWERDRMSAQYNHAARALQDAYKQDFDFKSAQPANVAEA